MVPFKTIRYCAVGPMLPTSLPCPLTSGSQSGHFPPSWLPLPTSMPVIISHRGRHSSVLTGQSAAALVPLTIRFLCSNERDHLKSEISPIAQQGLSPANLPDVIPMNPSLLPYSLGSALSDPSQITCLSHHSVGSFALFLSKCSLPSLSDCGWHGLPWRMTLSWALRLALTNRVLVSRGLKHE